MAERTPGRSLARRGGWGVRRLAATLVSEDDPAGLPAHWSERARRLTVARSALALIRQRPRLALLASQLPGGLGRRGKPLLWLALGRAWRQGRLPPARRRQPLQAGLAGTGAWAEARRRLQHDPLRAMPRLHDGEALTAALRRRRPARLFLWHHHDPLGEVPAGWLDLLAALQRRDWLVVVSSSGLHPAALQALEQHQLLTSRRDNIGRCIGAYKDLCLLLGDLDLEPRTLVLANDSMLPIDRAALLHDLERADREAGPAFSPRLTGYTDSIERGGYHLQSYWLEANGALLACADWQRFWRRLPISDDKQTLIDAGEIGLSQALLRAGVELEVRFPLLTGLLHDPAMALELKRAGIRCPRDINQSLQAWRSLLARGFPLVKKRVLFDGHDNSPGPPALAELIGALPTALPPPERNRLEHDLQRLLRSRHTVVPEDGR